MRASIPLDAPHPHFTPYFRARPHSASVSQKKTASFIFSSVAAQGRSLQAAHLHAAAFSSATAPHPRLWGYNPRYPLLL